MCCVPLPTAFHRRNETVIFTFNLYLQRVILPSKRLAQIATAVAVVAAAGIALPPLRAAGYAADVFLLLACGFDLLLLPRRSDVRVKRLCPSRVSRAVKFILQYEVDAGARASRVEIRDELPPALDREGSPQFVRWTEGGARWFEFPTVARVRGVIHIPAVHVRAATPLGLLILQLRIPAAATIECDPSPDRLEEGLRRVRELRAQQGRALVRVRGRASAFEQLREHVEGDEFRTIDWKASARRGNLTVREYRTERNREVMIYLDAGRRMGTRFRGESRLDVALDSALSLARVALEGGDRVGFVVFADQPVFEIAPRRGIAHFQHLYERVRHVSVVPKESNLLAALRYHRARRRKRGFLLMMTDLADPLSAQRVLPAIASAARGHSMFFIAIDDPERRATEDLYINNSDDAYLVAGARQLRSERTQWISDLRRAGVRAADLAPNEITGPVLDAYLQAARFEEF